MMKHVLAAVVCAGVMAVSGAAVAQEVSAAQEAAAGDAMRFDVEVDPIAYALDGYSLHVGVGRGRYRLDVGNFALWMPQALHGQEGFDARFGGFGVKLDAYLDPAQTGGFVGLESAYTLVSAVDERSGEQGMGRGVSAGARVGWRFDIAGGLYVVPWVGVGYRFGEELTAGGRTFAMSPWSVFPTIHIGYRIK